MQRHYYQLKKNTDDIHDKYAPFRILLERSLKGSSRCSFQVRLSRSPNWTGFQWRDLHEGREIGQTCSRSDSERTWRSSTPLVCITRTRDVSHRVNDISWRLLSTAASFIRRYGLFSYLKFVNYSPMSRKIRVRGFRAIRWSVSSPLKQGHRLYVSFWIPQPYPHWIDPPNLQPWTTCQNFISFDRRPTRWQEHLRMIMSRLASPITLTSSFELCQTWLGVIYAPRVTIRALLPAPKL